MPELDKAYTEKPKTLRDINIRLKFASESARELIFDHYDEEDIRYTLYPSPYELNTLKDKLTTDNLITALDNLWCVVDACTAFLDKHEHIVLDSDETKETNEN